MSQWYNNIRLLKGPGSFEKLPHYPQTFVVPKLVSRLPLSGYGCNAPNGRALHHVHVLLFLPVLPHARLWAFRKQDPGRARLSGAGCDSCYTCSRNAVEEDVRPSSSRGLLFSEDSCTRSYKLRASTKPHEQRKMPQSITRTTIFMGSLGEAYPRHLDEPLEASKNTSEALTES